MILPQKIIDLPQEIIDIIMSYRPLHPIEELVKTINEMTLRQRTNPRKYFEIKEPLGLGQSTILSYMKCFKGIFQTRLFEKRTKKIPKNYYSPLYTQHELIVKYEIKVNKTYMYTKNQVFEVKRYMREPIKHKIYRFSHILKVL